MDVDGKARPASAAELKPKAKARPKERGTQLLAPWLDHKGGLNEKLWRQLVNRLMSIVITSPGRQAF